MALERTILEKCTNGVNRHYKSFLNTLFYLYIFWSVVSACGGLEDTDRLRAELKKYPLTIDQLQWIAGEWKFRDNGTTVFELWAKRSDKLIEGTSFSVVLDDTVIYETMRISEINGEVFFIANVAHNNGEVAFKLTKNSSKGLVFENIEHDYPTRIIYANTKGDMLLARLEGVRDGKQDTVRYFMNRNYKYH